VLLKSKKISDRIILLVLSLVLVTISVGGYATYSHSRKELLNSIGNRLYEVALRMESELARFMEPASLHINALQDTVRAFNLTPKKVIPIINEMFNARPEIDEVSILNMAGQELYRHGRLTAYQDQDLRHLATDPLVKECLKNGQSVGPVTFSKYLEPRLRMVFTIRNERGKSMLIDVTFNLKWMWSLAQKQAIGETGYVYIVGADGKLISYPDHSLVLAGKRIDTELPSALLKNKDKQQMQIYTSLAGQKVVGISHYDEQMKWWIVVELPTAEGLAPLSRMLNSFIFIFICAALFTIVSVLVFVNITMRPLQSIMQAIARISNGDSGVKVDIHTGSELSTLAEGINDMAGKLDERIHMLLESQAALLASRTRYMELNKSLEERIEIATQELRETNYKLIETLAKAEAASESTSMFLANTSHELRTPLNAILGYSELICESAEENQDTQLAEDAKKIIYSARYLLELINNLLDLSKIEKGKLQLLPEQFSLKEFLDSVVDTITPLAEKNGNRFKLVYPPEIGTTTHDITRLRQIIINLVGNACKFTHDGEVSLYVNIIKIKDIESLHFCVSDTGIGMTPEQLGQLFEVFQQADAATTRRYGGSGLGLALSKQLAILMKGDIHASSVYGEGSDFILIIPLHYTDSRLETDSVLPATGTHSA